MNVKKIITEYLKANGYDGLCNPDLPCGCGLDNLFPCEDCELIMATCQPAYKFDCPVHGTIYGPDKEKSDCAYCVEEE